MAADRRWEHALYTLPTKSEQTDPDAGHRGWADVLDESRIERELDARGREGWEVVCMVEGRLLLKRSVDPAGRAFKNEGQVLDDIFAELRKLNACRCGDGR